MSGDGQPLNLGRALLLVTAEMDPNYEEEINHWFDEEHFPERIQCPGFLWGRRYRAVDGGPKYVNLYGLKDADVLTSEAYLRIRPSTERRDRVVAGHQKTTRSIYVDITPHIPDDYRVNAVRKPNR